MPHNTVVAVVSKVVEGRHGSYAICFDRVEIIKSPITFSLSLPCWEGEDSPEGGMIVVLTNLRRKKAGWRALNARYLTPQDEATQGFAEIKPATSHKED